jgi:thiosulfate dehydrogenase [quinone] large subunit
LRLFLGVSFCYAGVDKLAGSAFLNANDPASLHATMQALGNHGPLGPMITWLTPHATAVGAAVAAAELAVGLATLAGLWVRWAAAGGLLLNLTFLLTVHWQTSPWYENPDIAYCASWLALAIAAPLPATLHTWVYSRPERAAGKVAEAGHDTTSRPAPILPRRLLLTRLGAAAGLAVIGAASAAAASRFRGRSGPGSPGQPVLYQEQVKAPPGTPSRIPARSLPPGQATKIADGAGWARWLVHTPDAGFVALATLCTHAYCPVQFLPGLMQFGCPCHGSTFDARDGAVLHGPAITPLPQYSVQLNGEDVTVS